MKAATKGKTQARNDELVDQLHEIDLELTELRALLALTTAPDDSPPAFSQLETTQQSDLLYLMARKVADAQRSTQSAIALALPSPRNAGTLPVGGGAAR